MITYPELGDPDGTVAVRPPNDDLAALADDAS